MLLVSVKSASGLFVGISARKKPIVFSHPYFQQPKTLGSDDSKRDIEILIAPRKC
jgi:hypothetical protein